MNTFINIRDDISQENKRFMVNVKKDCGIEDIKVAIQNKTNILSLRQYLYLGDPHENGILLSSKESINKYNIANNSDLYLLVFYPGMIIFIKTLTGNFFPLKVKPTNIIEDIQNKIKEKEGIPKSQQRLVYKGKSLKSYHTLFHYLISDGTILHLLLRLRGGGNSADRLSEVVGYLEQDTKPIMLLPSFNKLPKRYIRNTNSTGVYCQRDGTCYAYAACSAYINTIMRIYGSRPPPTFKDCYDIACYSTNGGSAYESIQRLEEHFGYGIEYNETSYISIRDVITISVVVNFSTSEEGWQSVANGSLLKYPGGKKDGYHSALVEGYDFEKDCFICKNSWGGETAKPRFDFTSSAAHVCYFNCVFFTLDSIKGKTTKPFNPKMKKCVGELNGKMIDCAWMGPTTAAYCSEYVCEYHPEVHGIYKYFGYDTNQWININLNRPKDKKHPKYYYRNRMLKRDEIEY